MRPSSCHSSVTAAMSPASKLAVCCVHRRRLRSRIVSRSVVVISASLVAWEETRPGGPRGLSGGTPARPLIPRARELDARAHAHLREHPAEVVLDRLDAEEEGGRDL